MQSVPAILVDRRNFADIKKRIFDELQSCAVCGYDIETQDLGAHAGIKQLRKENDDGDKLSGGKFVFDWRAMVVTGFSMYPAFAPNSYYFNLAHADVANRLSWDEVVDLIDSANCAYVIHNKPFEATVLGNTHGYAFKNAICTMQMAVTAYGPDEFDTSEYVNHQFGAMKELFPEANRIFDRSVVQVNPIEILEDEDGEVKSIRGLSAKENEFLGKILGKSSKAAFSYNGFVNSISYSYGLKKMVKKFFDFDMETFDECLKKGNARHMGELTGEQVCAYGADDAYWAVQVFFWLCNYIEKNNPAVMKTFLDTENPMCDVYTAIRREGLKVNRAAIEKRRDSERVAFAGLVRELKANVQALLPFPTDYNEKLMKQDAWYGKVSKGATEPAAERNRKRIIEWANSPDTEDNFKQAMQVSSPVSNAWSGHKSPGLSIGHYMQIRMLMYDLCRMPVIMYKGKVQSDGETRGEVRDKIRTLLADADDYEKVRLSNADRLLKTIGDIVSLEQRMKLYLTPYTLLTDPETSRMYPEVSSMLATRRMGCSNPNGMQLAKRGDAVYVRGYYEPDAEDEVMISFDWSQVELVEIGDFSGDPEFALAYGQIPYKDLHLGAAADVLSVVIPEVTEEMLKVMHTMQPKDLPPKLLIKPNGEPLTPESAKKYWRTEVGKGSNFNYWYSGALSTVGEKLHMTSDQMWKATELYRERFSVAEQWRVQSIENARHTGYIELPDHHRRVRWEATYEWQNIVKRMFDAYQQNGLSRFGNEMIRALKTRAGNQIVNALIQGTSATLAKRSILRINQMIKETGIRARFKLPIHDELLYSVHKDDAVLFIKMVKPIMCSHPDIIRNLQLYSTASVGLNFEPFHPTKQPIGQIELDEAPTILGFGDGVVLNDDQIQFTIDYLFKQRLAA